MADLSFLGSLLGGGGVQQQQTPGPGFDFMSLLRSLGGSEQGLQNFDESRQAPEAFDLSAFFGGMKGPGIVNPMRGEGFAPFQSEQPAVSEQPSRLGSLGMGSTFGTGQSTGVASNQFLGNRNPFFPHPTALAGVRTGGSR